MPTPPRFGVVPDSAQPEPAGYATLIPDADPSIAKIDMFITGWSDPTHTLESQAGTERLEDGSVITDHVVAMPAKLSMTGWVSDLAQSGNAPEEAWGAIRDLQRKEDVLQVVTEWGVYDEMFIVGANTTQTTRGMKFTIDLQEIVRVNLQPGDTTNIDRNATPTPDGPKAERNGEVNQGRVSIPATDLGDGRFRVGLPGQSDRRILTTNPDGTMTIEPAPPPSETDGE